MAVLEDTAIGTSDLILINLRGTCFATRKVLFQNIPDSKLSKLCTYSVEYNSDKNDYFFDRNPLMFHFILDMYSSGKLHLPQDICAARAKEELEFWEINPARLESCCWKVLHEIEEEVNIYNKLAMLDDKDDRYKVTSCRCFDRVRRCTWTFLTDPKSSVFAKIWFVFILINAVCSIVVYGLQTHSSTRIARPEDVLLTFNLTNQPLKISQFFRTMGHPLLNVLDLATNSVLLLDLLLRGLSTPCLKNYICNFFNICESLAVFSVFVMQYTDGNPQILSNEYAYGLAAFCGWIYGTRVLRILRLAEHSTGMKLLRLCLFASKKELAMLALSFLAFSLISASLIFTAEVNAPDTFSDFFICLWWSVITMTTVGYGDYYPKSAPGYVVGSMTAITGILLLAMPIAILSSNFSRVYGCFKIRGRYIKSKNSGNH